MDHLETGEGQRDEAWEKAWDTPVPGWAGAEGTSAEGENIF